MAFEKLPPFAAWRHCHVREGFEVVFLQDGERGLHVQGHTAAVEEGQAWSVEYSLVVDGSWATRSAHLVGRSASGRHELALETDGSGGWLIDGMPDSQLKGCLDIDLESSSFTNALPVHRLRLGIGHEAEVPAAYVRAFDLAVERLEQRYVRRPDAGTREHYDYSAPRFEYSDQLVYDENGLLLDYPGIAVRVA